MNDPAKTIMGHTPDGDEFSATLSTPFAASDSPEWVSTIHCPGLFEADKSVAGVDPAQALELAEILVTELFNRHGIQRI